MFRKIRSNRDPNDTVFSEIHKEFLPYFERAGTGVKAWMIRFPRIWFGVMVSLIALSLVLSFVVLHRGSNVTKKTVIVPINPVSKGFSQIIAAGEALNRTIRLKRQVDSLSALKVLSQADSLQLSSDLDTLSDIRKSINH